MGPLVVLVLVTAGAAYVVNSEQRIGALRTASDLAAKGAAEKLGSVGGAVRHRSEPTPAEMPWTLFLDQVSMAS